MSIGSGGTRAELGKGGSGELLATGPLERHRPLESAGNQNRMTQGKSDDRTRYELDSTRRRVKGALHHLHQGL